MGGDNGSIASWWTPIVLALRIFAKDILRYCCTKTHKDGEENSGDRSYHACFGELAVRQTTRRERRMLLETERTGRWAHIIINSKSAILLGKDTAGSEGPIVVSFPGTQDL